MAACRAMTLHFSGTVRRINFFAMDEMDLSFKRFDGSNSPIVTRAAFKSADAAIVLPYDPVRDRVLLVEQFRVGPYLRGASDCWSMEPIAGLIDAFETPKMRHTARLWKKGR